MFLRFPRVRVGFLAFILSAYLYLARAEDSISVKWQDYREDGGRIRVVSKYLGAEKQINNQFALRLHGVYDSISGASPTGSSQGEEEETVPLSGLEDTRKAGVVDLDWSRGIHKTSFQYSHSKESDYLSRGLAVYNTSEYNKRNTGLSYGFSYIDDEIRPFFFDEIRRKRNVDAYVGLSQVLDPNTVVSLNFTYSEYSGYLNDPYKVITQNVEVIPDVFLPIDFSENRPEGRVRRIWFANTKRFFPAVNGAIDIDYRFFNDTWGIESHTFDFEWYQNVGERWVVRPSYRIYQQNDADFFYRDLDEVSFRARDASREDGPYFSADYRLAKMNTETFGMKIVFKVNETLSLDGSFERYYMKGETPSVPQATFPDADIITLGGRWWF